MLIQWLCLSERTVRSGPEAICLFRCTGNRPLTAQDRSRDPDIQNEVAQAVNGSPEDLDSDPLVMPLEDAMDVQKVDAEIARLIADTSSIDAQSQWVRFALGAVAFCLVAGLTKLFL